MFLYIFYKTLLLHPDSDLLALHALERAVVNLRKTILRAKETTAPLALKPQIGVLPALIALHFFSPR